MSFITIPNAKCLVKKADLNAKISEIENEIPNIASLATNSTLNVVKNKIPDVSSLVNKTDYDTKVTEIEKKVSDHNHDKYITTPEFNNIVAGDFTARLAQADLVKMTDFYTKLQDISKMIASNKTKHLVFVNELKKLKTFDSCYFKCKCPFEEDGTQNYLVFQLM